MKRKGFVAAIVLLVCSFSSMDVWAQATAQISGTVRDQSGAVLPGVEVTATQTDTGIARIQSRMKPVRMCSPTCRLAPTS